MDPMQMIFGIVAVSCVAGVLKSYFYGKHSASLRDIEDLKRRVEALERWNR